MSQDDAYRRKAYRIERRRRIQDGEASAEIRGGVRAEVLNYVREHPGVAEVEVVRAFAHMTAMQVRNALSSLKSAGAVISVGFKPRVATKGPKTVVAWGAA